MGQRKKLRSKAEGRYPEPDTDVSEPSIVGIPGGAADVAATAAERTATQHTAASIFVVFAAIGGFVRI